MSADRWQRLRDVFEGALEVSPDRAKQWVEEQTSDDIDLRQEVLSLLNHHERAASFLSRTSEIPIDALVDAEQPQLTAGQTIGAYTVIRELGRGGMGRVYVATDTRLNRTVALKSVSGLATDPIQRERLRREARAAASLVHPGICTVYALEEIDGQLFIASEFVDGRTLRDEINDKVRPPRDTVAATLRELTEALACAHEAGITHGDLKPENIVRAADGRLKILDFGLARVAADSQARVVSSDDALTQEGMIIGTPGYMAPEQLKGRPRDTRSDVFSLGVSLYEFATGMHPFQAATALAIVARVLNETPRRLEESRPDVDAPIARIIDRCLSRSTDTRFANAGEVLRSLVTPSAYIAPGPVQPQAAFWWRIHQAVVIALYFVASAVAWHIKEQAPGTATVVFLIVGTVATIAGVFRGHLLFTERINVAGFHSEQLRARPITLATDVALAIALIIDGSRFASESALIGLLTIALGIGLALVRLVVEPATTAAAFGVGSPATS